MLPLRSPGKLGTTEDQFGRADMARVPGLDNPIACTVNSWPGEPGRVGDTLVLVPRPMGTKNRLTFGGSRSSPFVGLSKRLRVSRVQYVTLTSCLIFFAHTVAQFQSGACNSSGLPSGASTYSSLRPHKSALSLFGGALSFRSISPLPAAPTQGWNPGEIAKVGFRQGRQKEKKGLSRLPFYVLCH